MKICIKDFLTSKQIDNLLTMAQNYYLGLAIESWIPGEFCFLEILKSETNRGIKKNLPIPFKHLKKLN